jgi:hypothetical protein
LLGYLSSSFANEWTHNVPWTEDIHDDRVGVGLGLGVHPGHCGCVEQRRGSPRQAWASREGGAVTTMESFGEWFHGLWRELVGRVLGGLMLAMGTAALRADFPGESAARESRQAYRQLVRENAAQSRKASGKDRAKKR